jgi:hypothetical protein
MSKAYGLVQGDGQGEEGKELGVSLYVFKELRGSKEAGPGEMKRIKEWFKDGMDVAGGRCLSDQAKREPGVQVFLLQPTDVRLILSCRNDSAEGMSTWVRRGGREHWGGLPIGV